MAGKRDIKFYFSGDTGKYDQYHPQYVYNRPLVPEIISILSGISAKGISIEDLADRLGKSIQKTEESIESLERINAIKVDENQIYVNFTIFTVEDQEKILRWSQDVGERLAEKIYSIKDSLYKKAGKMTAADYTSIGEILYHIIGCYVLDWKGLEVFSDHNIMINEKPQPGERKYVLIGMEETDKFNKFTSDLICSSQNISVGRYLFSSFGDQTGRRVSSFPGLFWGVDHRLRQSFDKKDIINSYNDISRNFQRDIAKRSGQILTRLAAKEDIGLSQFDDDDRQYIRLLLDMGYIKIRGEELLLQIPVFLPQDFALIREISNLVIDTILEDVQGIFKTLSSDLPDLTAVRQEIDIREMLNEVWHQVFAKVNLVLMERDLLKAPDKEEDEGYYHKSLYYLPRGEKI